MLGCCLQVVNASTEADFRRHAMAFMKRFRLHLGAGPSSDAAPETAMQTYWQLLAGGVVVLLVGLAMRGASRQTRVSRSWRWPVSAYRGLQDGPGQPQWSEPLQESTFQDEGAAHAGALAA